VCKTQGDLANYHTHTMVKTRQEIKAKDHKLNEIRYQSVGIPVLNHWETPMVELTEQKKQKKSQLGMSKWPQRQTVNIVVGTVSMRSEIQEGISEHPSFNTVDTKWQNALNETQCTMLMLR